MHTDYECGDDDDDGDTNYDVYGSFGLDRQAQWACIVPSIGGEFAPRHTDGLTCAVAIV